MALVSVPPFESFYEEHKNAVLGELRRLVGPQAAEDAYQETFLRALRAYERLRHADNLRAWVLTIARRVAVDHYRRREATPVVVEPQTDSRPAYAELGELADGLPRKERAAVVLREGMGATGVELMEYCKKNLVEYKVPRQVELRTTMPMSASVPRMMARGRFFCGFLTSPPANDRSPQPS